MARREDGQAVVEMGLILLLLILVCAGIFDMSRAFYQYTVVSAGSRYGARWASVVGGVCGSPNGASTSDWCNQLNTTSVGFWKQPGNVPLQAANTSCPSNYSSTFTGYYLASDYIGASKTTIVGAVAQKFDTSGASTNFIQGALTPGFDLTQLRICIGLAWDSVFNGWASGPGDKVTVNVYYPFRPSNSLLSSLVQVNLVASSTFRID